MNLNLRFIHAQLLGWNKGLIEPSMSQGVKLGTTGETPVYQPFLFKL